MNSMSSKFGVNDYDCGVGERVNILKIDPLYHKI
jgi:hypothetical protein